MTPDTPPAAPGKLVFFLSLAGSTAGALAGLVLGAWFFLGQQQRPPDEPARPEAGRGQALKEDILWTEAILLLEHKKYKEAKAKLQDVVAFGGPQKSGAAQLLKTISLLAEPSPEGAQRKPPPPAARRPAKPPAADRKRPEWDTALAEFQAGLDNSDVARLRRARILFENIVAAGGPRAAPARGYLSLVSDALEFARQAQTPVAQQPPPAPLQPAPPVRPAEAQYQVMNAVARQQWEGLPPAANLYGEKFLDKPARLVRFARPDVQGSSGDEVAVLVQVDETGGATFMRVLQDPAKVGDAAKAVVPQWKFEVPTVGGKAVKTTVSVKVFW